MKHTEETKNKISKTMKNRRVTDLPPWNVGLPSHRRGKTYNEEYGLERTKEIINKLSNSMKVASLGHIVSKETREKIGNSNRGKTVSFETRLKISKSQLGMKKPWATRKVGHKVSEETRRKISLYHSGDDIFTGFKQDFKLRLRNIRQYREWRYSVFKRDNFTCVECGHRVYLEAHHIISLSDLIKQFNIITLNDAVKCGELWNIDNGISYCQKCHVEDDFHRAKFGIKKK